MQISDILSHKGSEVISILPSETLAAAAKKLTQHRIGALVVRDRLGRIVGMISERDVVVALAQRGGDALTTPVSEAMSPDVITCRPTDPVREIMALITVKRIRHIPVCEGDRLLGLVSIGDVLKSRLDEKELELNMLRDLSIARV
ncbi:MAG TPA: CBS domain-containing protein [Alphaproteobacteria bacterium]|nr:CBS domain-containing protein [Alphaproteobacteria bacterium]